MIHVNSLFIAHWFEYINVYKGNPQIDLEIRVYSREKEYKNQKWEISPQNETLGALLIEKSYFYTHTYIKIIFLLSYLYKNHIFIHHI